MSRGQNSLVLLGQGLQSLTQVGHNYLKHNGCFLVGGLQNQQSRLNVQGRMD